MAEMPKNTKLIFLIFSLAALGAIAAGIFFYLKAGRGIYENKEMEVEVIEGAAGEGKSLSGMLQDEATEEAIKQDALRLEMNADNGAGAETEVQLGEPETDNQLTPPLSEPEKSNAGELKIGLVADIHARSNSTDDGKRVLKPFFEDGINYFVDRMNASFRPDFILANGDLIEGTGRSSSIGKKELSLVLSLFERTAIPKYWVVGNHDLRSVKKSQWKRSLRIDYLHKAFEVGDYKIIILDSNFTGADEDIVPDVYYTRGRVSEKEIAWLERELKSTDKDIIVFIHHPPLWNVDFKENGFLPSNSRTLQVIFSKYNVLAVFAGHMEDIYINEAGDVKYFVLPGFVKNKKYQKAFSEITIKNGEIVVDMSYLANEEKYRTVRITDN